jgi:RNA-directed DNA polymerase
VKAGELPGQVAEFMMPMAPEEPRPAAVRAAIVAQASRGEDDGEALAPTEQSRLTPGGAKGGREANASSEGGRESTPPAVLFGDKQGGEAPENRSMPEYGAERIVWSEKMLAALHERRVKGNKWYSLIDKVTRLDVLEEAWAKVHSNAGACGVDGITVERFSKDSHKSLLELQEHLKNGSYQPKPVRRVWIPKPGSAEKRPLGIPTVRDRVVQTALKMVIEPVFEREFAEQSYGFRPGRGCKDALRRVDELLKSGFRHVVDADIKGYFDTIGHQRLMARVEERISDGRVLDLIEQLLKQGIMEGLQQGRPEEGTPQGAVISPLLANLYLNPLDWVMQASGLQMVRYADDFVVLCRNQQEAREALQRIGQWMEEAGLTLHPQKTRLVDMNQEKACFEFLGYRFYRTKAGKMGHIPRPKSEKKLRESLKPLTRRLNGHSLRAIIARINPILRGWHGYFQHSPAWALEEVDEWVRSRLRSILRKRHKGKGRSGGKDHQRWPIRYFDALGLFNLKQARTAAYASLP